MRRSSRILGLLCGLSVLCLATPVVASSENGSGRGTVPTSNTAKKNDNKPAATSSTTNQVAATEVPRTTTPRVTPTTPRTTPTTPTTPRVTPTTPAVVSTRPSTSVSETSIPRTRAAVPTKEKTVETLPTSSTTPVAEVNKKLRYIVRFVPGTNGLTTAKALAKGSGGTFGRAFSKVVNGAVLEVPATALAALRRNPNVLSVERDATITATPVVPDTQLNAPWGLDRIDQRALPLSSTYSAPTNAAESRIFVVDTGVSKDNVDFGTRVVAGYDSITAGGDGSGDCNGHGTHVAGTVGGSTYGVAKAVTIVPVRVLDCAGSGSISSVIAGLDWVASQHQAGQRNVVNMSLGGGVSSTLDAAVSSLVSKGVTVVVAAGNSNVDACNSSPARVAAAITVAATDRADTRASFSNFGSCVDVFAPGVSILSTYIGSATASASLSGTSMAAPHVAGVAALLLQLQGALSPANVVAAITANATNGVVLSAGTGSPNRLVFVPAAGDSSTTTSTSSPTSASVPAQPSAPIATARDKGAVVQWVVPADGGSAITAQTLRVFSGTKLVKTLGVGAATNALRVSGLRNGTSYTFTIAATNAIGAGPQSPRSNSVVPAR